MFLEMQLTLLLTSLLFHDPSCFYRAARWTLDDTNVVGLVVVVFVAVVVIVFVVAIVVVPSYHFLQWNRGPQDSGQTTFFNFGLIRRRLSHRS